MGHALKQPILAKLLDITVYRSEGYVERLSTTHRSRHVNVFLCSVILVPIRLPEDASYQPSIPGNMSQTPTTTTSTSNYQSIFGNAIEACRKKTKKDLRSHPLLEKLQNCSSPDAVLRVLYEQLPGFDQSRDTDDNLTKWLDPTVNVLCTFSGVIGGGIGLASPKELMIKGFPALIFDWHTGISTSGRYLHWNWRPSLSEFFFLVQSIPGLIVTPNSPRQLRRLQISRACSLRSLSA